MKILVTIPCNATKHSEVFGANPSYENSFLCRNSIDGKKLDADKCYDGMNGRKVSDEVGEDARDAIGELGVHEAEARDTNQASRLGPRPRIQAIDTLLWFSNSYLFMVP